MFPLRPLPGMTDALFLTAADDFGMSVDITIGRVLKWTCEERDVFSFGCGNGSDMASKRLDMRPPTLMASLNA